MLVLASLLIRLIKELHKEHGRRKAMRNLIFSPSSYAFRISFVAKLLIYHLSVYSHGIFRND